MNKNSKFESTKAWHRGGATRSSVDGTVMVAVAKGLHWISYGFGSTKLIWEEP